MATWPEPQRIYWLNKLGTPHGYATLSIYDGYATLSLYVVFKVDLDAYLASKDNNYWPVNMTYMV